MVRTIFIVAILVGTTSWSWPAMAQQGLSAVYDQLQVLEQKHFGRTYTNDLLSERLERLERAVYGHTNLGSVNRRLDNLSGTNSVADTPRSFQLNAQQTATETSSLSSKAFQLNATYDDSSEMKLLWDDWHHNFAKSVFEQYEMISSIYSRTNSYASDHLTVTWLVKVQKNGIIDAELIQTSGNSGFDHDCATAISNVPMQILAFPPKSQRKEVQFKRSFSWNMGGKGFGWIKGDVEMVPGL